MSARARLDLLIFGFLVSAGKCAVSVQIPISAIRVTTNATWYSTWTADKVNDGVIHYTTVNPQADDCDCCAALFRPSWVQLSLENIYIVERIEVLGRQDAGGQFDDIILSMGLSDESLQEELFSSKSKTVAEKRLTPPREMKLVRVGGSSGSDSVMTICEIVIYRQADCQFGRYSVNCSKSCHCLKSQCESVTGTCRNGICEDGWEGIACNESCSPRNFGANCSSICHCHNDVTCNNTDGACSNNQCAAGWTHDNCSVACGRGLFGMNCSYQCHCLHEANCDPVSGHCPNKLCAPGWTQSNCSIACTMGSYGHNCSMDCHCDTCHHVNGSCEMSTQCHDGYRMENGFCKHKPLQPSSNSTFNVPVVVGVCVGAGLVLTILIAVVIVFYKRRNRQSRTEGLQKPSSSSKIETSCKSNIDQAQDDKRVSVDTETQVTSKDTIPCDDHDYYSFKTLAPGIKLHELWDYIHEKCQSGSTFFDEEFEKLRSGLIHKHNIASSEENKGKNRYKQMYAYDHCRVPLTKEFDADSEYINASFIHGFEKMKKFIASQGATEKMIDDFWRMIWQQRVDKIVMLTNVVEMGTLKCMQYWPVELNGECKYGNVGVKYVDIDEMFDYNIRTFQITKGMDARTVKQFHFKKWPDKDVPDTAWCLVDFWRAVDTRDEHHSPILVHCSAGVGRTGTFIALDNLISQAKITKCVRPFQMVEALREQRVSMVQTKKQYKYLHEALAEALLMGTHHVLTREFESVYNYMMGKGNNSTTTRLEYQFELVMQSMENRHGELEPDTSQDAEYGNIEIVEAEINAYRPLQQRTSDQPVEINIPTFRAQNGIRLQKKPTEEQLSMFWSHLEQLGSITLIDISSDGLELKHIRGINKGRGEDDSTPLTQVSQHSGFVEISYSVTGKTQEGRSDQTIKHFVLTSGTGDDSPTDVQSLLKLIEAVHTWQSEMTDDKPILILDNAGFQKCGVVAVLLNEIYRILENNGQINILESVKTMVQGNSLLIRNKIQVKFCYDAILEYVQQQAVYQNY